MKITSLQEREKERIVTHHLITTLRGVRGLIMRTITYKIIELFTIILFP